MTDSDCIFCKIIDNQLPSRKVYEDDNVLAFLDINPIRPGHTLVIPKKHSSTLLDMDDYDVAALFPVAKRVAQAQKDTLGAEGSNVTMAVEAAGGQVVFHPHIHVIPRQKDDGLKLWPQHTYQDDKEADMYQEKLSTSLN